jgi:hypothetical protein
MFKKIAKITLVSLCLSLLFPVLPSANADSDYERICLTLGWTSCGFWTIEDLNGVQKNRVIGPTPLSALIALGCQNSGINLCGDSSMVPLGRAVLTGTLSPTPGAAEAAAAATAAAEAAHNAFVAAQAAAAAAALSPTPTPTQTASNSNTNSSDTRTVSPTPTPTPIQTLAPVITTGLGGYAIVHPDGHVCGVIVATSSDPYGNGGFMPIEYMGCPKWSRIVFQTTPSSSGNVAGWSGSTVTESNGQFKIGGGTDTITVRNGVATNTSGQSWDTGNGAPAAKTTDTKTVTSVLDTKTVVVDTDTRTTTKPADNRITSVLTVSSISNIESRTASAGNLMGTYSAPEKENILNVALKSNKSTTINITTDIPKINMVITAIKSGLKPIVFNVQTNTEGDVSLKTTKNLAGYTVTLTVGKIKLDSDLVRK